MEDCFHKPAKRIMDTWLLLILGRRTRQDPLRGKICISVQTGKARQGKTWGFPRNKNENVEHRKVFHGKKSPVFWWFYQTVNVLKMPRSRSVFSFRNSQGKLGVQNPLTPGKYAVYFTFSSTRKTWLNSSALSLVNRTFYQTVNVRKISRSWLVFQLRKRQGQLGIHHHLTEGKYAVHVTLSSTWKTGLNSSFYLVNRKFYQTVNVVKISRS